jgi:hypothetical protein
MPRKKRIENASAEEPGEPTNAAPETTPGAPPIVLVGQPGALKGELFLHNPGEARMVFRGAALRSREAEAAALEEKLVARKVPSVIVRPGERRRVPLRFALDPTTPPGEYHANLQTADQTIPLVFHVTERIDLEISPKELVLHNQPGALVTKDVVLRNLSNVELTIEEISAVPLDDELAQCRILRAVAAVIGSLDESDLDEILTEFAHQSQRVLEQAGILRVRNRAGRITLQPGEVRRIQLEIRLPESLERRTRYRGVLPIYNADLVISIVPALDVLSSNRTDLS